jgi:hypothetical protein
MQHRYVLYWFGLEELKKESSVGHFENDSKIAENKTLAST